MVREPVSSIFHSVNQFSLSFFISEPSLFRISGDKQQWEYIPELVLRM